ncbi:MAG: glycosyltransferase family 4 protein [Planctomycetota bacterium]|nr:glycosyltransferase family 4 protein [Planctomycetota bacterium]
MKVLLLAPPRSAAYGGATATVHRYRDGLSNRGHICEVFDRGVAGPSLEGTIERFHPDVVHAHDAHLNGISLLGLRLPWVVSTSGEDVHLEMMDPRSGPMVCEVIRRARRVMVPTAEESKLIEERIPCAAARMDIVARAAVLLPTAGTDLRRSLGISRRRFLVLVAGGLRPSKAPHRALVLADVLRRRGVDAEVIIAGSPDDLDYAQELRDRVAKTSGVRLLPALPRDRMGAAYMDADVVLETSSCEGMSSTILEAGLLGRPVIAGDIPANRSLVTHKRTGLLYAEDESMIRAVLAMAGNRSAAGALGLRMREDFERRFGSDQEMDGLLSVYAAAVEQPSTPSPLPIL